VTAWDIRPMVTVGRNGGDLSESQVEEGGSFLCSSCRSWIVDLGTRQQLPHLRESIRVKFFRPEVHIVFMIAADVAVK
jgi:hypothetical protein